MIEILFNVSSPNDILNYQIKETMGEPFQNLQDDTSYYLNRYKRSNVDAEWILDSVWTVRKTNYYEVVTEGNFSYLKLSFPFEEEKKWNGNTFFGSTTYQSAFDEYQLLHVYEPYTLLDSTDVRSVTVVQEDVNDNCIERDDRI